MLVIGDDVGERDGRMLLGETDGAIDGEWLGLTVVGVRLGILDVGDRLGLLVTGDSEGA